MHHFLQAVYAATWLWLPFLVLFLVQGLRCSPSGKLLLFKIALYYIVSAIGLQLLVPTAHLALRTMLFDLTTRVFLFIQAAELLWNTWNVGPAFTLKGGVLKHRPLDEEDESDEDTKTLPAKKQLPWLTPYHTLLIVYVMSTLLYLGWTILGLMFAFTLTPGL